MQNVLIADDHAVTRRGLRDILREAFEEADVLEASSGHEVLRILSERDWDLIMLDIHMPGPPLPELLGTLRESTKAPILVLTAATEVEYVLTSLQAGANGLIHKHRAPDELVRAIEAVMAGRTYLHGESAAAVAASIRPTKAPPHELLSERELEVFRLIATGRAIKEIAGDLQLSDKTIATYLSRIRDKTGLNSHVDIARYALQHGLVS